jgi:hypothetical protein
LIKNDPQAPSVCVRDAEPKTSPTRLLTEVRSPIDALLAAREARGRFAESAILQQATGAGPSASTCDDGCVLEFALAKTPEAPGTTAEKAAKTHVLYNDPPLGWSLSETSRSGIENRLQDPDVQERLRCVRELVSGGHCASAPVCSR